MRPSGWSTTDVSGSRAWIGWKTICASCNRREKDVAANTDATATSRERELVVTRVLDAPRRLVFKAWTEPEQVARWWGPQGFVTTLCEMDIWPGGAYRVGMRSSQGTHHVRRGVYREIVEP